MKRTVLTSLLTATLLAIMTVFVSILHAVPEDDKFERPPGVIIAKSPDFQKGYVGSPSNSVLLEETCVASHNWFGEGVCVKTETKTLSTELFDKSGNRLEIGDFGNGQKVFSNRDYTCQNVPWELQGWKTVRNCGGEGTEVRATAKEDVETADTRALNEHTPIYEGWDKVNAGQGQFHDTASANTPLIAHRNRLLKGETVMLSHLPCWTGEALIFEETQVPFLERLKYNNPGLVVDLGVGLWAWPIPMDVNGDGFTDLVVVCEDKPYNGTYVFEHPGTSEKMPVFKKARRISQGIINVQASYIDGKPRILSPGLEYPDFHNTGLEKPVNLPLPANVHPNKLRGNMWKYVDYDGDGKLDLLIGIDDWTDYGWDNAYDANGNWLRGPLRGYLYIAKNTGTNESPVYAEPFLLVDTEGNKLETFGWPCPNMHDWDGDGDLDIICGEFLDGFTWFENVGIRTEPKYAKGIKLTLEGGAPLQMDLQMVTPVAFDWTGDGHDDLICGDEDGRVALIENTGKLKDGRPVFLAPKYFQQEADEVKCGALATPCGVDWDGDGDWDIICGNTAGYIVFYENLSGPGVNTPKWAAPKFLDADGKTIRFMAGPNGSIQGPCEAKWGYTTLTVADWNEDGLPDIMVNTIWGKVVWFENVGTKTNPKLAAAKPVEVEWDGPQPTLAYGWLRPNGKELLTQWRTTPCMFDWNGDGLMDLLMLDHEGYFCFFERKNIDDRLVLLPPKRVLLDDNGQPLRLNDKIAGGSGRRKICMVDYDGDGKTDFLLNTINADFYRQIKAENGLWYFKNMGPIDWRNISGHSTSPSFVDFDGNGIPDPLIGAEDGYLYFYYRY